MTNYVALVVGVALIWLLGRGLAHLDEYRSDRLARERAYARRVFKHTQATMIAYLEFREKYPHIHRSRVEGESPWTYARDVRRSLHPSLGPLGVELLTWEIPPKRRFTLGHKIWRAKHKTKSDVEPGSYSRVERETAMSGIKLYHWFARDEANVVHRVACLKHDATHSFVLLCDQETRVEDARVSQSEVGHGPALTCVACTTVDAP